MNEQAAQNAVTFSGLIVGAIYLLRKFTEPALPTSSNKRGKVAALAGLGPLPSAGRFVVGWGFAFLVISALAQAQPELGGRLAQLVLLGDVMTNWTAIAHDLNAKLQAPSPGATLPAGAQGFSPLDPLAAVSGTEGLTGTDAADAFNSSIDRLLQLNRLGRTGKLSKADKLDPLAPFAAGTGTRAGRAKISLDQLQEEIDTNAATRTTTLTDTSTPVDSSPLGQGAF